MKCHPAAVLAPLVLILALSSTASLADQTDQRLDTLFTQLHSEDQAVQITAEGMIWEIWFESGLETIDALMSSGREAALQGEYEIAEAYFTQVIEQAPDYSEGWNRRATIRYFTRDYQGSLADIQQTIKLEPRHFGAIWGLGMILGSQHRYADAIVAFERLLEIKPSAVDAKARIELLRKELLKQTV